MEMYESGELAQALGVPDDGASERPDAQTPAAQGFTELENRLG